MKTADERRARWNASVSKMKSRGIKVEDKPAFLIAIEEWINGHIPMSEVQSRYVEMLKSPETLAYPEPEIAILEDLLNDMKEVSGLRPRDETVRSETSESIYLAWDNPDA